MFRRFISSLFCCAALLGCDRDSDPSPTAASAADDPVPLLAERARATGEKSRQKREPGTIIDPSFELRANAEGRYEPGKPGRFQVTIRPKGKYHLNLEFPSSIAVEAPQSVSFPKSTLSRADAELFGEQLARFEVQFTPAAAGTHRVEARATFAVCTPKVCIPKKETLTVDLSVQ